VSIKSLPAHSTLHLQSVRNMSYQKLMISDESVYAER
jgi:hypothetical protein